MARRLKTIAGLGLPPLRDFWREINREERETAAEQRAKQKARDKRRPKCRCEAYPWPHRPGGGLCRYPDPPLEKWQPKEWSYRPYRKRYAGLRRQIARNNGLHPIRDKEKIEALMPGVWAAAKDLKREMPRMKYKSIEITETGVRGSVQTAGPMM